MTFTKMDNTYIESNNIYFGNVMVGNGGGITIIDNTFSVKN